MKELIHQVKQLLEDRERFHKIAVTILLILIIGVALAAKNSDAADEPVKTDPAAGEAEEIEDDDAKASGTIYVDIGGAVNEPMLAELPRESRVEDAIVAAGGLTDEADLTSVNRAEFLEDGEKIYIPKLAEDGSAVTDGGVSGSKVTADGGIPGSNGAAGGAADSTPGGKININTADASLLQEITGVGPATAQKIINYRNTNGRFKMIEDIKNVSGIGDKTFEKMKDQITT